MPKLTQLSERVLGPASWSSIGTELAERIIEALEAADGPLTDAQLAAALESDIRASINQTCHALEKRGVLIRRQLVGSRIRNALTGVPLPAEPDRHLLGEDEVKAAVRDHLQRLGYVVKLSWGHERGIDIDAIGPGDHLLIEAKGEPVSRPRQVNYFLGALGELVLRFAEPGAKYPTSVGHRAADRRGDMRTLLAADAGPLEPRPPRPETGTPQW